MPLNGANIKDVYDRFANREAEFEGRTGRGAFVSLIRRELGLYRDTTGRPRLRQTLESAVDGTQRSDVPRVKPEEISILELARAICGENWVQNLRPDGTGDDWARDPVLAAEAEGASGAISPGNLPNVSAYLGTITGLLEAKILEAYQKPEYIADQLVQVIPTKLRQDKLIGTGRIGDKRSRMTPGEAHPRVQFQERYVTTPETQYDGLAIDVTTHAVFFDQTNQVLERAETVGDELALGKEFECIDAVLGVTNAYNYNGTAYNTYMTSGNWINDQQCNLVDWTDLDLCRQLFSRMTDQETGNRITIVPDTILVSPAKFETANQIIQATTYQQRTNSSAEVREGRNREQARYTVLSSPYVDQRCTDADGLNLSQANANEYWWMMQRAKAFAYMENWGITTRRASPSDYTMLDHNLVLSVFANMMGVVTGREPRYVIRNKNE